MKEHILVVSTSDYFANNIKDKIKHYDMAAAVTVLTEPKIIASAPEKIRADILFLETNCWYGATPMFISKILEKQKKLTVCVFGYEELPAGAVASFFRFGAAGYLDIRLGLESVYEGIKKIMRGNTYVPARYKECVERSACDDGFDGGGLSASEYWLCRLVCFGLDIETCAEVMKITPSTARYYKAQVYKKLNVHNTSSLVEKCRQLGIVKADEVFENVLSDGQLNVIHKERKKDVCKKQLRNYTAAS
jgi:DNA-binding NarL/FixJ family response regulator